MTQEEEGGEEEEEELLSHECSVFPNDTTSLVHYTLSSGSISHGGAIGLL